MTQQIISMDEFVDHLSVLEQRIDKLEIENTRLLSLSLANTNVNGNVISKYVERELPKTNIISHNFLKRSFSVWGHFFIANLLIGIAVGIFYACLMMNLFGSVFNTLLQNHK
jgi:hypothetical protein